jgi:maltose O-acetyltransferase
MSDVPDHTVPTRVADVVRAVVLNSLAGAVVVPNPLRLRLLRQAGVSIGEGVYISPGCTFVAPPIAIGDNCFVNRRCTFEAGVEIEADVDIGPDVSLLTSTHEPGTRERRAGRGILSPVRVGRGTWIGAATTVLPGVTIGEGCVIAAGSIVSADCEPHGLYAGVPATRRRDLP